LNFKKEEIPMKVAVNLTVNGQQVQVEVEENKTLLYLLREVLHLTGTKEGCSIGECGACTVLMDGRSVYSCLVIAQQAEGKEILTIEGLNRGREIHPIQQSFASVGAVQCGYCTPGMILSAKALLDANPNPTLEEIKVGLSGNLCRCTGYTKIFEAVKLSAEKLNKEKVDDGGEG
jgi:carbon-monoxide dehydrogenase small subunit